MTAKLISVTTKSSGAPEIYEPITPAEQCTVAGGDGLAAVVGEHPVAEVVSARTTRTS